MKHSHYIVKLTVTGILLWLTTVIISCVEKVSPEYVIGVSQCSDDEWRDKLNVEIAQEAMFRGNIEVIFRKAYDDNQKQMEDIQFFIDKKVDLLIVSPNESAPVTPAVEKAFDHGIPVIVSDRKVLSEKYTAFVGPDNYEIGVLAGEFIAGQLNGKGKIVEILGTKGSSASIERHEGFISVIKNYPEIEIVYSDHAVFLESIAEKKMEEALSACDEIDLVFALNDRMAKGAYRAARRAGREKDFPFVGIDALPGEGYGVEMVMNDMLLATFVNPTGGDKIVSMAVDILEGRGSPREVILPSSLVDKRIAKTLKLQWDYIEGQHKKSDILNQRIATNIIHNTRQEIILYSIITILILLFAILYLLARAYKNKISFNRYLIKNNTEIVEKNRQLEKQHEQLIKLSKELEEATHSKLMFYTNISHDFLTPLTLLIDPLNQLLSADNLSEQQRFQLQLMKKNTGILERLVRQVLDFRKLEHGKLELALTAHDLTECIREWSESFNSALKQKQIRFNIEKEDNKQDYTFYFDYEKTERIFYNLFSNAIKFTGKKGMITVNVQRISRNEDDFIVFSIRDTGIGMNEIHLKNIFSRFYKIHNQSSGSGLGLALSKGLAELHGGDIYAESTPGTGSTFTVMLPFRRNPESEPERENGQPSAGEALISHEPEFPENMLPFSDDEKPVILLIDDNKNVIDYLSLFLEKDFNLLKAFNGEEGWTLTSKYLPDLIVSDVMMPLMDGLELCRKIKEETLTSHIPVVLLTACELDEQRIEGAHSGADAYISKPFNSAVLTSLIQQLLENRKRLKTYYTDPPFAYHDGKPDRHKSFLDRLYHYIDQHISNPNLNVNDISREMGLSRVQLYRKVKNLTKSSPSELLRVYRLKKAKILLSSSDLNVSEVAYKVGFTSSSYFTKCYKAYFDELPRKYAKKLTTHDSSR